jgi:hypothetical protein
MRINVEDLDNQEKYRQLLALSYKDLLQFIIEYLTKKSGLILLFWSVCLIFIGFAIAIRVSLSGNFPIARILLHSVLGLIVLPLLSVPFHELLHIIPFYFSGAKQIRIGMDLKQYLFFVTAHRYVTKSMQFRIVAIIPFITVSTSLIILVIILPGLWKWSLSLFLFVHATMCAGDFAMLNYYHLNRDKKIYTWDDADNKIAYFYEEI